MARLSKIWKFQLEVQRLQIIDVPIDHRALHLALDGAGQPCIWAAVAPGPSAPVKIIMVGAGHDLPHVGEYLGMVTMPDGLVWHYFTAPDTGMLEMQSVRNYAFLTSFRGDV